MATLFEQIIQGEIPSDKVFENERILVIKDLYPAAPVHLLIVPKKVFKGLQALPPEELPLLIEIVSIAQRLAKEFGIEGGYRFLTNNGAEAGQSIFHLHFHLIGGKHLGPVA